MGHILSQVRLFSKEHTALKFMFYEKTPAVKPIYGKKNFKSVKITLFWARKDNRMPFFSDFSRKNNFSNLYCTYFLKNRPLSKKHLFLCPYYVKKTSFLTKTNCSRIIFIKIFIK